MTKRPKFTKEFEREAVRLAEMSGRTRREIIDLFAGRVVGWAVSDRLHCRLTLQAL